VDSKVGSALGVFRNPLFGQLALVIKELCQGFAHLRLDGCAHHRDLDGDLVGVGQLGHLALAGQGNIALEVHRGALDVSGVVDVSGLAVELAHGDHALDLEVLRDHGAHCLWQKGGRQDLVERGYVIGEIVNLACLRGKVCHDVLPVPLGEQRLVNHVDRLIDGYGVFTTS